MKHLQFTLVAVISFILFGCSNISSVQSPELSQKSFHKVLVIAEGSDISVQQEVEYRTVREFLETGVDAYVNYEALVDGCDACLILQENESAKLFDMSTGQIVWTGNTIIAEDFVRSSKEIANDLINEGIVVKTPSAIADGKKEIGLFTWIFSALLVAAL